MYLQHCVLKYALSACPLMNFLTMFAVNSHYKLQTGSDCIFHVVSIRTVTTYEVKENLLENEISYQSEISL